MLSRCFYKPLCSTLYTSNPSFYLPGLPRWRGPILWSPLRLPPWLSAVPLHSVLVISRASVTFKNISDGRLGIWLLLRWLKRRKTTAKAVNQECDSGLSTAPTARVPTLKCKYPAIQGSLYAPCRNPSHVRGLHVWSGIHTVEGRGMRPLQHSRIHAFTCKSIGTLYFSTAATGLDMKLRNPDHANDSIVSLGKIRAPRRKVVQKRRWRGWQDPNTRRWTVRPFFQRSLGGKVEKGVNPIPRRLNPSSSRWTIALARIRNLHSVEKPWFSQENSRPSSPSVKGNQNSLESWIASTQRHKLRTWEIKLIHTLRENPLDTLKILRINLQSPRVFLPGRVVEDCLDHLSWLYLDSRMCSSSDHFDLIHSIVGDHLKVYGQMFDFISLSQRTIRLLSRHCDVDQLVLFIEKLNKYNVFIHTNTKLHLMPKLVECGKVGLALSLLKHMPAQDLLLDKVQMFCVLLLRAELEVENLYRLRSNILAFMLEAGVRPNRFLANIIILNAMEAGDLNTAWSSHDIAKENGLAPDAGTYTALLKGIQHGDSNNAVWLVYREAKLDGCLAQSSRLKFELLYGIYLSNNSKYNNKPYSILLQYYSEFFDIKPLRELGIFHSPQSYAEEGGQPADPPVQALGLIILAWLTETHDSGQVLAAYERYLYHTKHNHPLIAQLAQTDHTANAFTVAFGRLARTVHICTQVVQDMLKAQVIRIDAPQSFPSTSNASHANDGTTEKLTEDSSHEHVKCESRVAEPVTTSFRNLKNYEIRHIAPPTVQTWSILLFAFIKHRQSDAAEKVLALMEARGQKPNLVTWNSLLSGYARMQDFPGIVRTLRRMDQACLEDDEWTSKALARVIDRDELLRTFEKYTKEQTEDTNLEQALSSH